MAHYAKVENGIVTQVIVADAEYIGSDTSWIQTSYNTKNGIHYDENGEPDDGIALRGNYAAVGMIYDSQRDAFYVKQPYESWSFNEETFSWDPPVPVPNDLTKTYRWNEDEQNWVELT